MTGNEQSSPETNDSASSGSPPAAEAQETANQEAVDQSSPTQPAPQGDDTTAAATVEKSPEQAAPVSLDKIRELRQNQQKYAGPLAGVSTKHSDASVDRPVKVGEAKAKLPKRPKPAKPAEPAGPAPKVAVPSTRHSLSQELEDELEAALVGSDLDKILVGDSMLQVGHMLTEGQRIQSRVMKTQADAVFVSLGGPNEAVVPLLQFDEPPENGSLVDVVVRGYLADEGMYEATLPGRSVEVSDWDDINEGEVIEVQVTGSNTGGLECKVGVIRGFIPASQVAEYRVEDFSEYVDQKVLCVVTEANARRGNLVLSRRAVLEREKAEMREERLANLEVGAAVEGTVRKILDFGAFVDIGGLDGLLHISQLSYERVKHPSEILQEGQQIQVRVDKIDEATGKIGLSYRSLQEHPWTDIDTQFSVGSIVTGTVTRIAEFGAFVKIATGVEGLVHVSEMAHHRVTSVGNVVKEGEEISVKILSIDTEQQRMSLSIKGVTAAPEKAASGQPEVEEEPAKPVLAKHQGPLKGGVGRDRGGEQFGLKW